MNSKLLTTLFGIVSEIERDLLKSRVKEGLEAAKARGRKGGRRFKLTKAQIKLAQAAMQNRDTSVSELCKELSITRPTLYRYVSPNRKLRDFGYKVLNN